MPALARFLAPCLLTVACYPPGQELLCPESWHEDDYRCAPDSVWLADQPAQGAHGFARRIEGGCGPGDFSCEVALVDGLAVDVLDAQAVSSAGTRCEGTGFLSNPEAEALAGVTAQSTVTTDDEGRFAIELPPGAYCLRTLDPVVDEWIGFDLEVEPNTQTLIELEFDHGAY